jgi:hypothetical protein
MTNRVVAGWAFALGLALVAPVPAATAADVKDKAVEVKDSLQEKAVEAKDAIKEKAVDVKDAIKDKTVETKDKIKSKFDRDKTVENKETLKDKAVDAKDTLKEKAVDAKDTIKEKTVAAKDKVKSKLSRDHDRPMAAMDVRNAQSSLKAKGFDPGPIDGIHGPRTRVAVQDFQRSEGLPISGQLDAETSARLSSTSRTGQTGTATPSASPVTTMEPTKDQPNSPAVSGRKSRQAP